MQDNLNVQLFPTNNILVVPKAISDKHGLVKLTEGLGSENSTVFGKSSRLVDVEAITLTMLFKKYSLDFVDFMKVDIEGAEPLLAPDLNKLSNKIKLILIEFSYKNNLKPYKELIDVCFSNDMHCFLMSREDLRFLNRKEALDLVSSRIGNYETIDLFFINSYIVKH